MGPRGLFYGVLPRNASILPAELGLSARGGSRAEAPCEGAGELVSVAELPRALNLLLLFGGVCAKVKSSAIGLGTMKSQSCFRCHKKYFVSPGGNNKQVVSSHTQTHTKRTGKQFVRLFCLVMHLAAKLPPLGQAALALPTNPHVPTNWSLWVEKL